MTATVTAARDPYEYWRLACNGISTSISGTEPQPGFYRLRTTREFVPVAIWIDEGVLIATVDGEAADPIATWAKCARHPVSHDAFQVRMDTGSWPGEEAPAGIGHNLPPEPVAEDAAAAQAEPDLSPFDLLQARAERELSDATAFADSTAVDDDAAVARCEKLAGTLTRLAKEIEAAREEEKRPILEQGRLIDARYKPLHTAAQTMAKRIKALTGPYLKKLEDARRAAAAAAIAQGVKVTKTETRAGTSGTSGERRITLIEVKSAVIEDYAKTLEFFRDHPEIRETVQRLANAAARINAPVPGVRIETRQEAR